MASITSMQRPFTPLLSDPVVAVTGVTPRNLYVDGERTDKLEGYVYTCVDMGLLTPFRVLVRSDKPVITQEELMEKAENGERVFAELVNARFRTYYNRKAGAIEDSIVADNVLLVE